MKLRNNKDLKKQASEYARIMANEGKLSNFRLSYDLRKPTKMQLFKRAYYFYILTKKRDKHFYRHK